MDRTKPVIMIVDDDSQVIKSMETWLKTEGFEPLAALNEEQALKAVSDQHISATLLDLKLDGKDALIVARKLKAADKDMNIIILTGFPSYETAVEAMRIGAADYLSKGASNEQIMKAIKKAIAKKNQGEYPPETREIPEKERVRLLLFCDHLLIQERLENHSRNNPRFHLQKTFPQVDLLKIKDFVQETDIALVCASCNLKNVKDSYKVLTDLYRYFPKIKPVIINENFSDREKVELLTLGVRGFASPDLSSDRLERGLLLIKKGGFLVNQNVINMSLQSMIGIKPTAQIEDKDEISLTTREAEILKALTLGLKNREIADRLFISEKTVKTHINRIFRKLGVDNRAKAILAAVEKKIC